MLSPLIGSIVFSREQIGKSLGIKITEALIPVMSNQPVSYKSSKLKLETIDTFFQTVTLRLPRSEDAGFWTEGKKRGCPGLPDFLSLEASNKPPVVL